MLDSSLPHRAKTTESLDKRRERERASLFSVKLLCEISWTYFYTLPFPLIPSHMTAANNRYTTRRRTSKEEAFDMAEEAGMKESLWLSATCPSLVGVRVRHTDASEYYVDTREGEREKTEEEESTDKTS
jgi:hypothetical protein